MKRSFAVLSLTLSCATSLLCACVDEASKSEQAAYEAAGGGSASGGVKGAFQDGIAKRFHDLTPFDDITTNEPNSITFDPPNIDHKRSPQVQEDERAIIVLRALDGDHPGDVMGVVEVGLYESLAQMMLSSPLTEGVEQFHISMHADRHPLGEWGENDPVIVERGVAMVQLIDITYSPPKPPAPTPDPFPQPPDPPLEVSCSNYESFPQSDNPFSQSYVPTGESYAPTRLETDCRCLDRDDLPPGPERDHVERVCMIQPGEQLGEGVDYDDWPYLVDSTANLIDAENEMLYMVDSPAVIVAIDLTDGSREILTGRPRGLDSAVVGEGWWGQHPRFIGLEFLDEDTLITMTGPARDDSDVLGGAMTIDRRTGEREILWDWQELGEGGCAGLGLDQDLQNSFFMPDDFDVAADGTIYVHGRHFRVHEQEVSSVLRVLPSDRSCEIVFTQTPEVFDGKEILSENSQKVSSELLAIELSPDTLYLIRQDGWIDGIDLATFERRSIHQVNTDEMDSWLDVASWDDATQTLFISKGSLILQITSDDRVSERYFYFINSELSMRHGSFYSYLPPALKYFHYAEDVFLIIEAHVVMAYDPVAGNTHYISY